MNSKINSTTTSANVTPQKNQFKDDIPNYNGIKEDKNELDPNISFGFNKV